MRFSDSGDLKTCKIHEKLRFENLTQKQYFLSLYVRESKNVVILCFHKSSAVNETFGKPKIRHHNIDNQYHKAKKKKKILPVESSIIWSFTVTNKNKHTFQSFSFQIWIRKCFLVFFSQKL